MSEDPDADALEAQAERLERQSDELGERIEHVRSDWQSKQADQSVPGATEGPDAQDEDDGDGG